MIVRKNKSCCSGGPIQWLRRLSLADGSEVSVIGLDMIFSALVREQRAPDREAASEIVRRLSLKNNIPPSLEPLYADAALSEYEAFLTCRLEQGCEPEPGDVRPGLLSRLRDRLRRIISFTGV